MIGAVNVSPRGAESSRYAARKRNACGIDPSWSIARWP